MPKPKFTKAEGTCGNAIRLVEDYRSLTLGATFVVGVQFHPEALIAEDKKDEYLPIFEALRDAALKKR